MPADRRGVFTIYTTTLGKYISSAFFSIVGTVALYFMGLVPGIFSMRYNSLDTRSPEDGG